MKPPVDGAASPVVAQEVRERDLLRRTADGLGAPAGKGLPDGAREVEVLEVGLREADDEDGVADGGRAHEAEVGADDPPARVEQQAPSAVPDGGDDAARGAAAERRELVGTAPLGRREVGEAEGVRRGTRHDERLGTRDVEEALGLTVLPGLGRRVDDPAGRDFRADEPLGRKGEEVALDVGVDAAALGAEHEEDVVGVRRVDEGVGDRRAQAHEPPVPAAGVDVGRRDFGAARKPGVDGRRVGRRQEERRGDQGEEHGGQDTIFLAEGQPISL